MAFHLALIIASLAAAEAPPQPQAAPVKSGVEAWERGDFARAVELWRGPAIAGDADAQFNLGQAYKMGRGVPVDLRQAEDWYRRAALQGHRQAQDNYGLILYQNGKRAEAIAPLEASANRGEPRAQYVFGTELFNGEFVKKDWVRAYAMMTRASQAGIPRASENLAQMDRYVSAADRQRAMEVARVMDRASPATPLAATSSPPVPGARPITPVEVPPSQPSTGPGTSYPVPGEAPAPVASAPAAAPVPARTTPAAAPSRPAPAAPATGSADGPWRVQLGAFSEGARAQALWETLSGRVSALSGKQPYLVKGGAVTRLQAGGFASQSAASSACIAVKAAGNGCLVVKP